MTEVVENTAVSGPPELEESSCAATQEQTDRNSLSEAFQNTLDISQDVEASEDSDRREKKEQEDGQKDKQQDGQKDKEPDEETVPPPAAESSNTETKWAVGSACRAVWSEDGCVYAATVVAVDGDRCRVRFHGYGNQEDVDLSSLRSPDVSSPTQKQNSSQDWRPGSRCRAVYSEDGLVYPAVLLWVKGQRCCVRFDNYDNEEETDVNSLLNPDELHGPSRVPTAKGSNWKSSVTSGNLDWKRRRREENQGERGGGGGERGGGGGERGGGERGGGGGERRSARRDEEQNFSWLREKASPQSKVEKESEEKKRGNQQRDEAEKPTNHSFSFFPPFPPPPQSGSGEPVSLVPPPPPPLWSFGGAAGVDPSSSMLMLWYMCGFHTGSYMAQQGFKSHSKD
ncbi:survival of motor neuron protein-like isoform X2 [Centropristis striata]|uniref:survival of motor neuron protein-like isoform X2 n=1 Tax=Centropristis striata TaxID=184440 RepID=UPI0027E15A5A|nr:survival of motor neuron protein-like isoform X2 [Centropristis striata]